MDRQIVGQKRDFRKIQEVNIGKTSGKDRTNSFWQKSQKVSSANFRKIPDQLSEKSFWLVREKYFLKNFHKNIGEFRKTLVPVGLGI